MIIGSSFPKKTMSNAHWETIVPRFFGKIKNIEYDRERLELPDGDFLDLDWKLGGNKKLIVFSHGLEGCSQSKYIKRSINYFIKKGYDCVAWNNRGCSGEMNRLLKMYHSGASEDFKLVIEHILGDKNYEQVHFVGFSMGGNITLKYLGEQESLDSRLGKTAVVSVPLSLEDCANKLSVGFNKVYIQYFLRSLIKKLQEKSKLRKDFNPDITQLKKIKTFKEFDDLITAPINGFKNAEDYWEKCSSYFLLDKIKSDTLIINAKNDPFLAGRCYPKNKLAIHKTIDLELPESGGHVGFMSNNQFWINKRIEDYISS